MPLRKSVAQKCPRCARRVRRNAGWLERGESRMQVQYLSDRAVNRANAGLIGRPGNQPPLQILGPLAFISNQRSETH